MLNELDIPYSDHDRQDINETMGGFLTTLCLNPFIVAVLRRIR
jgi:hypothetical protein